MCAYTLVSCAVRNASTAQRAPERMSCSHAGDVCELIAAHSEAAIVVVETQRQLELYLAHASQLPLLKAIVMYLPPLPPILRLPRPRHLARTHTIGSTGVRSTAQYRSQIRREAFGGGKQQRGDTGRDVGRDAHVRERCDGSGCALARLVSRQRSLLYTVRVALWPQAYTGSGTGSGARSAALQWCRCA